MEVREILESTYTAKKIREYREAFLKIHSRAHYSQVMRKDFDKLSVAQMRFMADCLENGDINELLIKTGVNNKKKPKTVKTVVV
jgi:hypothetical protein